MPQRYIDGFEFGETGGLVSGSLPVADFPRLQDLLRGNAGEIAFRIEGRRDDLGRPALQVDIGGELLLTCQRCMEAMPFRLNARSVLVLARNMAEIEADDALGVDGPDRILAGREMPVRELIEDEVLLSVPVAPRHEECAARRDKAAQHGKSPFEGLRGLLGGGKTN